MTLCIGVDAVSIPDMTRMLTVSPTIFAKRGWSKAEREWCAGRVERFAARWAAKEAAMKALGCGLDSIDPLDVEVLSADGEAPALRLHAEALRRATELGISRWAVSLTHEAELAIAFVVGYGRDIE